MLVRKALIHDENLMDLVPLQFSRELLDEVSHITGAGGDTSGNPGTQESWAKITNAARWAAVALDYLENEEPSPENMRAVQHAHQAEECLNWAYDIVNLEIERQRTGLPGTKHQGRKIYYEHIQQQCRAHQGQFVVIDINSGDYEVGNDHGRALRRLVERRPSALCWTERYGCPNPFIVTMRPR